MEPIIVKFTPTVKDYVSVARQTARPRAWRWLIGLFILGTLLVCGDVTVQFIPPLRFLVYSDIMLYLPVLALVLIGVGAWPLMGEAMAADSAAKQVQSTPSLLLEVTYRFEEGGITATNAQSELKEKWAHFASARLLKDYYFLEMASNKRTGRFVPRRAFETPEQEAAFQEMLKNKLNFAA